MSSEHEIASNFGPGPLSQQKFVVSINTYPNALGEMPSRIQEESQEFSCSLANAKDIEAGPAKQEGTLAISEERLSQSDTVDNIVDTQGSKFEIVAEPDGAMKLNAALSSERRRTGVEVEVEAVATDPKAFASEGSSFDRPYADGNLAHLREILSEQQIDCTGNHEATVEQLSKQVRSQHGVNPYSTMEEAACPNTSDQMMVGLARALL